ncbi:hypothetical protein [Curtobacterium sp. MCBD17_040]|uniref:hypothetical protein n=1 Tax=Curtobacterium sp. MCBD17_040 TaxID=2175674 RepID=UPI0011B3D93F|nr:hypothetical protein [Curtobacterium sp. MCBD17_040]WIB64238.1 hypothetical protein DEI94_03310 [Curtobacterium sp. MCBD17_040]
MSTTPRSAIVLIAATALVVTLAGCSTSTAADTATTVGHTGRPSASATTTTPMPSTTATPTTPPAATPPASPTLDLADPTTWTITGAGVGPLTIGGSVTAEGASMTAYTRSDDCPNPNIAMWRRTGSSVWTQALPDARDVVHGILLQGAGASSPRTAQGDTLGTPLATLEAHHPDLVQIREDDQEDYRGYQDHGAWIVFDVRSTPQQVRSIWVSTDRVPPYEFCG